MANGNLQVGDAVQLKGGSPIMTIESIRGETADVIWFNDGEMKRAAVPVASLTPTY